VLCYNKTLSGALIVLRNKKEKSIALPTLSADVGFPREKAAQLAVETILKFIKENQGVYDRIELFLKKRSEKKWYMRLLMQYSGLIEKIWLLYEKDQKNILSQLPRELIYYISQLILVC